MARVSISLVSRIRVFLSNSPFGRLLLIWLVAYLAVGEIFALWYSWLDCAVTPSGRASVCITDWIELVYFSFTTQATVGYGDYVPIDLGRWTAMTQAFAGITMNAVLLGIAVFKVLKRSTPIVFPNHLVYEQDEHRFWFRFINVDPDRLRDVTVEIYLLKLIGETEEKARKTYDTISSTVHIPFNHYPVRPSLNLTALRTRSNNGIGTAEHPGDLQLVILSPANFLDNPRGSTQSFIQVEMSVDGYFESTGDRFFATKIYDVNTIRCGKYDNVNNNDIAREKPKALARFLSKKLDMTIATSPSKCRECPYYKLGCVFDVAKATRLK